MTDPLTRIIVPEMWLVLSLLLGTTVAQYPDMSSLISSSWSMWSPWSFCSNDVMVRVRACSTVRGYKCVGHNKEFQSCDSSKTNFTPSPTGIPVKATGEPAQALPDLDFLDPYSEDRRLAMKQLYQDYEVSVPEEEKVSLKPRYRPASPVPVREPVIIAQYAQRFPQPPPEIEGVEFPTTTEIPPIKDNRHVIRTRPPVPWKTSTYAMPTSTASSKPTTTTTTTVAPTTTIQDSTESLVPSSMTTEEREREKVTSSTQKMSSVPNYSEESDNTQWEADESTAGPRDYEGVGDDEDQDENLEFGEKQVSPEINTRPTTTSTTSTTTLPSTTTTRQLVGPNTSTIQAAVNLLPTSIFLGSPKVSEEIPSASTTHVGSPSSKRKGSSTTGEWENMRGKQSRLRRIKLLSRRARVKSLSLMPKKTKTKNITIEITRKKSTTDLQNQRDELQKRIAEKKKQLADVMKSPATKVHSEQVEGDTARALSWMLANVERMMSEKTSQPIVDAVSVEKIDDDTDTTFSRLPSGVEVISEQESFVLKDDASSDPVIKVDKQKVDGETRKSRENAEWSDWSICNCGVQSRKSSCITERSSEHIHDSIDYRQRQRHRRASNYCPPTEYETRPCHSERCQS